jgi:CheY-like chemotaxis protein
VNRSRARWSVLVVDDEESVRTGLVSVLESDRVEVSGAASLQEAEGFLRRGQFDLVVTDLRMGGSLSFEGLEVIWRVRERSPETRIVLFTAFGTPEIEDAAKRLGASACWTKSTSIPEILERIRGLGIPVCDGPRTVKGPTAPGKEG